MCIAVKLPFSENLGHTEHACLLTKLHTFLASAWGFIVENTIHGKRPFIIFGWLAPHFSSCQFYLFCCKDRFDVEVGGWGEAFQDFAAQPSCTHPTSLYNIPGSKIPYYITRHRREKSGTAILGELVELKIQRTSLNHRHHQLLTMISGGSQEAQKILLVSRTLQPCLHSRLLPCDFVVLSTKGELFLYPLTLSLTM